MSVRNLVNSSNLPVSKVRQILHSKPSITKFTLATRNINRMKAFASFKIGFWCMDLTYVDKLARDDNGVKYLLVRQNLFEYLRRKRNQKQKIPDKRLVHFWLWLQNRIDPRKIGLTRERNLLESLEKFPKLKEYKLTLQWVRLRLLFLQQKKDPWKIYVSYRCLDDYRNRYIHIFSQFVKNLNSRKTCSIDLIPKKIQEIRLSVNCVQQGTTRIPKNQI